MTQTITFQETPGPRNASTDSRTGLRSYTWQGRKLTSVTSFRRVAGIPHGLNQWMLSQVINRAVQEFPTLTSMLTREPRNRERVVEKNRQSEASKWLRSASTEERDRKAALGTAVHDAAASGKTLDEVGDDVRPYLAQFLYWLEVTGAEVIASEFQVWNLTVGYAGSADALVRFPNGQVWLIDYKTGSGTYPEHAVQLIAYADAEIVGSDDVIDEVLTPILHSISGMAVLHLQEDHCEFIALRMDNETGEAFRALVRFASWMSAHQDMSTVTLASRRFEAPGTDPIVKDMERELARITMEAA
jgi:hypothetical protein